MPAPHCSAARGAARASFRGLQPEAGGLGHSRRSKGVPVVGRGTLVEHAAENGVGVGLLAVCTKGVLVVDPGEDDDLGAGAVAEEQPEALAAELGPEPVLAAVTERPALTIVRTGRVLRDGCEHQPVQGGEQFGVGRAAIALRIFLARLLDRSRQLFELIEKQRVGVESPAIDLHALEIDVAVDLAVGVDAFHKGGDPGRQDRRQAGDAVGVLLDVASQK